MAMDSTPQKSGRSAPQNHQRNYQACLQCRRRKVRCDLGPVDDPHDPPCVRCRRESKECYFSATRRKRKTTDGVDRLEDEEDSSDYEVRNSRKRTKSDGPPAVLQNGTTLYEPTSIPLVRTNTSSTYNSSNTQPPLTPGGSVARNQPLRRPTQQSPVNEEDMRRAGEQTAALLQTKEVYSGHDALNLLFEAAGRNGDIEEQHHRTGSTGSINMHRPGTAGTPGSQNAMLSPPINVNRGYDHRGMHQQINEPTVDPMITQEGPILEQQPTEGPIYEAALKAWSRFRFVRAGWLTAQEAVAYIDYFYTYLSPLTPIVVPDYREHAMHPALLRDEPMLVVTLLTVASRFMQLTGPGAMSRPYAIHEKLWTYLQSMIDRLMWGQEQFGGGFCGAGAVPGCDVNPLSRKGLRTLGTVESLMLLTEWHPRALHFPPGDDDDSLMVPDPDDPAEAVSPDLYKAAGGQRIDSWLEPCWRSDRMCWMLLSTALALAFEIGVFDETSENDFEKENQALPHERVRAYYRRKNHLKQLLIIYVTQTSGRLGLTSMLPKIERDPNTLNYPIKVYQQRVSDMLRSPLMTGPGITSEIIEAMSKKCSTQDLILDLWENIAHIMERGNQELFASRRRTRELIKTEKYVELLQSFQKPLADWRQAFDAANHIPTQLRHILTIEFEYIRVYLNSLALQAVVERCTHNTPLQMHVQPHLPGTAASQTNLKQEGGAIPSATLNKWYGNDRYYINEVIDASRNLLKVVVDGLLPGDYLKHAPVRTFFRIVSVSIILLKTFALGATEDDVAISLGLMDRAVGALRSNIVDDVHVGNRFANLLETLANRIRARFVRVAPNGGSGVSRAASRSPAPMMSHAPPMMPPPHPHQMSPWGTYQGHNGLSGSVSPSMGNMSGRITPNHPLWGISTETYDPNNSNVSIMPPPSFEFVHGMYNGHSAMLGGGSGSHYGSVGLSDGPTATQDWLAIPLDPLLNNHGADVTATSFGPDVGGYDLLDVLLSMDGTA